MKIHIKNNHWTAGSFPNTSHGEKVFTITEERFKKALSYYPQLEKHIEFLTLDHINGRKSMNHKPSLKAEKLCRRLKRDGYPKGIQVLCWNCNSAKSNNPFCPVHEWFKYNQQESRKKS